jgi:urease accessory protein
MRSDVLVVARPGRLPRLEHRGGIVPRITHADTVHLVCVGATPLGGDVTAVRVIVEPGARLALRSVSATIVLPGVETLTSHSVFDLEVSGSLDVDLEPTIVAAGSRHLAIRVLKVADGGRVRLRDSVQIGRYREKHEGFWSGSLDATIGAHPRFRRHVEMGSGATLAGSLEGSLATVSEVRYPADALEPADARACVTELAAGAVLSTWQGHRLAGMAEDSPSDVRSSGAQRAEDDPVRQSVR